MSARILACDRRGHSPIPQIDLNKRFACPFPRLSWASMASHPGSEIIHGGRRVDTARLRHALLVPRIVASLGTCFAVLARWRRGPSLCEQLARFETASVNFKGRAAGAIGTQEETPAVHSLLLGRDDVNLQLRSVNSVQVVVLGERLDGIFVGSELEIRA
ncbi:hypothetical protein C8R43DRAFT_354585 [Mycena crocata]|nr:hypothetical protein C8R43DRAFT_354585 [Mycena crocata]